MTTNEVGFVGTPGEGANINLNVPLPGSYTGYRLIELSGIDDEAWSDFAWNAGTPDSEDYGCTPSDDGSGGTTWEVVPETLLDHWFRQAQERTYEDRTHLELVRDYFGLQLREHYEDPSWRMEETLPHIDIQRIPIPVPIPDDSLGAYTRQWLESLIVAGPASNPGAQRQLSAPDLRVGMMSTSRTTQRQSVRIYEIASMFKSCLARIQEGVLYVPDASSSGSLIVKPLVLRRITAQQPRFAPANANPSAGENSTTQPRLFLRQTIGVSSFLGDYGLGKTLKTFTLLPGESMTISTRSWRSIATEYSQAYSMIDSAESTAQDRFEQSVYGETTDEATRSKVETWGVEASAKGSMGVASAEVSGSATGEYASGTTEFSKSVDDTVSEHAAESSSFRENTVTSSSESTDASEDETVVEREIKNINVRRVLNFVFRELNQRYLVKTHLKDVRVAFSNGNSGSWREVPLSGLRPLLDELFVHTSGSSGTEWPAEIAVRILNMIDRVFDFRDEPIPVLSKVTMLNCGTDWHIEEIAPRNGEMIDGEPCPDYEAPDSEQNVFYRFRQMDTTDASDPNPERGVLGQHGEEHKVPGVLLRQQEVTLATDSVVVEALLGSQDALDEYSKDLQEEAIREKRLANDREALAQELIRSGDTAGVGLFVQLFGTLTTDEDIA